MAKKYVGLEEAAEILGIQPDELVRLRETQKVRGFADRGTWKFKTDDLEELSRSLQVDSSPDVPIMPAPPLDGASASVLGGEEDAVGEQSTTIRGSRDSEDHLLDGTSDSDVRLILDDGLDAADSEPDMPLPADFDSDSDVQLFDDSSTALELGSDSDVALVGGDSDSDVRLAPVPTTEPGSDSDVRLVKEEPAVELSSDSDVKLVGGSSPDLTGSDSDVAIVPSAGEGSSLVLAGDDDDDDDGSASILLDDDADESGIQLSAESGISLENLDDSGISLEAESGLTLAGDDSGLSILDADSGLTLESDSSGISMQPESGISLEPSSGISLEAGSDIALDGDMDETIPMLNAPSLDDGDKDTELEIPSFNSDEDSEFELSLDDAGIDGSGDSSVLLFDDDDDDPDEHSATVVKKSGEMEDVEGETFDLTADADDEFDLEDDEFDDDDLDIADDVVGEDDELDDLDVFDADDDVFDEALDSGESHAEFAPSPGMGRVEVAAPGAEWGGITFTGLLISTGLMAVCTMLMFDLVRGMWSWNEPSTFNSAILDALSGLFG